MAAGEHDDTHAWNSGRVCGKLESLPLKIEDLVMTFPSEAYWDVTSQLASGTVWVQIDFTYDDGCGGTLSTTVIFEAPFANVA